MAKTEQKNMKLTEGQKLRLQEKIKEGAKIFESRLNKKCFKIVCEDFSETIVRFFQNDFQHLTGLHTDLNDAEFYDKCLHDQISTGNILSDQKYNWSTLRGKSNRLVNIDQLLYGGADKSLLLNSLKANTRVFPVAIRNDEMDICVGFVNDINKARSLRKAKSSKDVGTEKQIIAIYAKRDNESEFSEIVFRRSEEDTEITINKDTKS